MGELRARHNLLVDPSRVVGVREYRPEDPFRSIHWKATARQGTLQVRVAEPLTALRLGIFVNLDTFDHYWEGLDLELAERIIVAAASLAVWGERSGFAVGMYANGLVAGSDQALRVPPGRGPGQVPRLLEGLAMVSPFSTLPFATVLASEGTTTALWQHGGRRDIALLRCAGGRVAPVARREPASRADPARRLRGPAASWADRSSPRRGTVASP